MRLRLGSTFHPWAAVAVAALAVAGCGSSAASTSNDGSSPQRAVETFLAPFPHKPPKSPAALDSAEQQRRALALWQTMCDRVDPSIRKGLRVSDGVTMPDAQTACGAVVVQMAMYTGEDSDGVASPTTIAGTPRTAATRGDTSIVTVDVNYGPMPRATVRQPPARATVKVLVVKRDGRWWVAAPEAFNAKHASRGGLTVSQLHRAHDELLAAAR
jgi:hypothetical protein